MWIWKGHLDNRKGAYGKFLAHSRNNTNPHPSPPHATLDSRRPFDEEDGSVEAVGEMGFLSAKGTLFLACSDTRKFLLGISQVVLMAASKISPLPGPLEPYLTSGACLSI